MNIYSPPRLVGEIEGPCVRKKCRASVNKATDVSRGEIRHGPAYFYNFG